MKSIAFALMLVTVVVAQDAPQDVVVPVDCRADSDCQVFDSTAKCMEGMCDCSGDDRSRYCTAKAVDQAQTIVRLTLSFVFNLISCEDLDEAIRTQIHTAVLEKVAYTVTGYNIVCGSVIVVFNVDAEVAKVDEVLQTTTEKMQAVQQEVPVLQATVMSTEFVHGNDTKQCAVENSVSTIFLEDKICYPTCETGFSRVFTSTNGTNTYTCAVEGSDDDLSATAVAAVVIAVVLFCGIIVAIIYYVTGKPNDDVPTQNENEPYNEEKPVEEEAQGEQPQDITV